MKAPFIIYGLPRSRTFWLSRFLAYGDWECGHDEIRHARSMDDIKAWFAQPCAGTVETAAAPFWRLVPPHVRSVVVRRPAAEVVDSLMALGVPFDRAGLVALMRRLDHKLDQIERRVPGVLTVQFADLATEEACARVFEYCLPYQHDHAWWETMAALNLQISVPKLIRYYQAYAPQMERLSQTARQVILDKMHRGSGFIPKDVTISEEPFEAYFPGAIDEIRTHSIAIGEGAEYPNSMNFEMMATHAKAGCLQTMIARSNGRVFGYLLTVLHPAFIDRRITTAHHTTIWASDQFRGLGLRLLRAANDRLREKGVHEVILRAGMRGDGPRLGTMYRRVGAEECGQLYRLELQGSHAA